jgi:hypothetical protein
MKDLPLHVECYAGYQADERPRRFASPKPGARTFEVLEVLDQWYGIDDQCFKVRADDGGIYILRHDLTADRWSLDSFPNPRTP